MEMVNGQLCPVVVCWGVGVDSTAMLVGLQQLGVEVDLILFADTGGEKEETYAYIPVFGEWLVRHGMPAPIVVRYQPRHSRYTTLEGNCLANGTLPSLAYGGKSCSLKMKKDPQDKYLRKWQPALDTWAAGRKVVKMIGFDCSKADVRRRTYADKRSDLKDAALFEYVYPLQVWGWDRAKCERVTADAGLPVPPKSSCFFCPSMKPHEVRALPLEKLRRIVAIEANAEPKNLAYAARKGWPAGVGVPLTHGLWRRPTKNKPGSMTEFIRTEGLLPAAEIDRIRSEILVGTQAA